MHESIEAMSPEQHQHPIHDWEAIKPIFDQIKKEGFSSYASSLEGLANAFTLKDHCIRCIDEGTPGGIHIAGSGILMEEQSAIEAIKKAHAEGIYSHENCGAAGLYAKANGLDPAHADEYGKAWAKKLAELAGVPYLGHIDASTMKRPEHYHNARVAYYDGTGSFEPTAVEGLPSGFVISRKYLDADYAAKEAQVSVNIATGDHGYGELITSEEPFYLIAIGDEIHPAEDLAKELSAIAEASDGKVKILTLNEPVEEQFAQAA